ncbi:xanthine dehydrogenase family protein subunit M [Ruegeria pomeroyi]|uniref:Carbon monoxide dehydrogenase, medium subunit n=2 Tax=Ruegeria pomeroyi TaxID=89184 RepID=Q5LQT7_RUEPO|nr:xanthine dehydrogenase family protein subunit M [Ruegeria pomeroyi]HCE70121.1 xanthine dehydrogenase family protein subunit M [Ruegeria sp.]AAV95656.1 carbon monoxide dehydrogenase, medium subunit [Ruegeria pomeroyi DSS-3]NVK99117.1 xanthine dehydrogenase family protein subunit M [Ruegeria pomeroyi]NVL02797.1 xanthine dehydrogenase family protein subunit M [Ruegeria pomeroyi]QWV09237.1 xanthine dehydrogenase family protein subunit M [Ruegeria pomeroyi]
MIPAAFEYHRPKDMAGVLSILQEHGDDARVMAGGHSLIPMMKLRMAEVPHLIDLQDVGGMSDIEIGSDSIRIGAMVTQHDIIDNDALAQAAPILREAALQIADPQVRYMGTVGGNVANGDPGNDMPGLMQCLNATFTVVGSDGEREIPAREFYEAAYMTAREDDEVLTAVTIPMPQGGHAYEKQKRKIGDYATAAAAVQIVKDGATCVSASIAMTNLSDTPVYSEAAGSALVGTSVDDAAIKAAMAAMLDDIDPTEDNRGPVAFKKHVAGVILRRAIERAWSRT